MKCKRIEVRTLRSRYISFLAAIAVYLFILYIPLSDSVLKIDGAALDMAGRRSLGILAFCLVLWVREPVPFHVTGFIGILFMCFARVDTFANLIRQGFGNDTIVFFIGVLTLSSVVTRTGIGKRISVYILSKTGNSTSRILLGFLIVGPLLSMWMTAMAAAAILMPLAVTILQEEKMEPMKSNFGKALMIACAWGPLIGGIGTPAGAGPNPLAIGFISDIAGIDISFTQWMIYGIPSVVLLIIPSWIVLLLFFRPEKKYLNKSKEDMENDFRKLPPISRDERHTIIIFFNNSISLACFRVAGWNPGD